MSDGNSTNPVQQGKPERPVGSPLFWHATGRWCKKIRGRLVYFGRGTHAEALDNYNAQADDLHAGRVPRDDAEGLTVRQLFEKFLTAKVAQRDNGELAPRTAAEYGALCKRMKRV